MSILFGTAILRKITPQPNNMRSLLNYFSDKNNFLYKDINTLWNNEKYSTVKYEHIIKYNNNYYRRVRFNVNLPILVIRKMLSDDNNESLYDELIGDEIQLDISTEAINRQLIIIGVPIYEFKSGDNLFLRCNILNKKCEVKNVYSGSDYIFPIASKYTPYNYYGNWLTIGINQSSFNDNMTLGFTNEEATTRSEGGESTSYFVKNNSPGYIYKYKIEEPVNCLYFDEEDNFSYLLAHLMYFNCKIDIGSILYKDNYTVRDARKNIDKYNYTQYKNNLQPDKPIPPFAPMDWYILKNASSGDGDKSLAAKMCSREKNNEHLNVDGWIIKDLLHLMSCVPSSFLELEEILIIISPDVHPLIKDEIEGILIKYFELYKFKISTIAGDNKCIRIDPTKIDLHNRALDEISRDRKLTKDKEKIIDYVYSIYGKQLHECCKRQNASKLACVDEFIKDIDIRKGIIEKYLNMNFFKITPPQMTGGNYYKEYKTYKKKYMELKRTLM